jgi:hypothetical protein
MTKEAIGENTDIVTVWKMLVERSYSSEQPRKHLRDVPALCRGGCRCHTASERFKIVLL